MTDQKTTLLDALHYAAIQHRDQRRKADNGAPYVNHLIEVAWLLEAKAGVTDVETLQAAVLHDILEDTDTTPEELAMHFPARTVELVKALSDDKSLPLEARRSAQLEHIEHADKSIQLIKLADLCSNIQHIPADWSAERVSNYMTWSQQIAALCFPASASLTEAYLSRYRAQS